MFTQLLAILQVDDVPLLLSWTFALYMSIGATVELNYKDIKLGLLLMLVFFFSFLSINDSVYHSFLGSYPESFKMLNFLVPALVLILSVGGMATGRFVDKQIKKNLKVQE